AVTAVAARGPGGRVQWGGGRAAGGTWAASARTWRSAAARGAGGVLRAGRDEGALVVAGLVVARLVVTGGVDAKVVGGLDSALWGADGPFEWASTTAPAATVGTRRA